MGHLHKLYRKGGSAFVAKVGFQRLTHRRRDEGENSVSDGAGGSLDDPAALRRGGGAQYNRIVSKWNEAHQRNACRMCGLPDRILFEGRFRRLALAVRALSCWQVPGRGGP